MAMTIKRVSAALIGVVVAGAVLLGVGGAPAHAAVAWESNEAGGTSQACGAPVKSTPWAVACFIPYGDVLLVFNDYPYQDTTTPWVAVQWVNELRYPDGSWDIYRQGTCTSYLGSLTMGACNKDFYENTSVNKWGGKGSRIAFKACEERYGCSALSAWVYNDN